MVVPHLLPLLVLSPFSTFFLAVAREAAGQLAPAEAGFYHKGVSTQSQQCVTAAALQSGHMNDIKCYMTLNEEGTAITLQQSEMWL